MLIMDLQDEFHDVIPFIANMTFVHDDLVLVFLDPNPRTAL